LKEPDTVTGKTLTITLAAAESEIISMIFGDDFDVETGIYFERASSVAAPVFAFRAWVSRYTEGTNVKGSQTEMMVRSFPSCTGTPGSSTDEEGTFAAIEITADAAANSVSNMTPEFKQFISITNYKNYVSA
jgi:hypothetical protein